MLRRDFVRAVVSISFAPRLLLSQQTASPVPPPAAPVPWTLGLNPKTPLPHTEAVDGITETERRFFTPLQMAALVRLCNVLMPPIGNKPGAVEAGTPLFLDFLIGASPAARGKVYAGGLDWLNAEAQKTHRKSFAELDDAQADVILKPWLRTWMADHPPTEPHADFVNIAHSDIRKATVNSKAWSEVPAVGAQVSTATGLYWAPIDPGLSLSSSNCIRMPAHVIAAPKASHTTPSYPQ
jgi:hypothetical protein